MLSRNIERLEIHVKDKRSKGDLVSFEQIPFIGDNLSSDFLVLLLSNRSRLRPAYHLRNTTWHCVATHRMSNDWSTSTATHSTGTNGKLVLDRSFIQDPLLAKGKIFIFLEKIQNQIEKIWKFYSISKHSGSASHPNLGAIEAIFRSGEQNPKPYVQIIQYAPKLN